MPRASKQSLPEDILVLLQNHLAILITSLTTKNNTQEFLNNFLTHEEQLMLSKRLMLYMMISKNYSATVIKKTLQMSFETIRQHTHLFKGKHESFHSLVKQLTQKEESKSLWKYLDEVF